MTPTQNFTLYSNFQSLCPHFPIFPLVFTLYSIIFIQCYPNSINITVFRDQCTFQIESQLYEQLLTPGFLRWIVNFTNFHARYVDLYSQRWKVNKISEIFLKFAFRHQISSDFTWFYPISPVSTRFHPISPDFTRFHPMLSDYTLSIYIHSLFPLAENRSTTCCLQRPAAHTASTRTSCSSTKKRVLVRIKLNLKKKLQVSTNNAGSAQCRTE